MVTKINVFENKIICLKCKNDSFRIERKKGSILQYWFVTCVKCDYTIAIEEPSLFEMEYQRGLNKNDRRKEKSSRTNKR